MASLLQTQLDIINAYSKISDFEGDCFFLLQNTVGRGCTQTIKITVWQYYTETHHGHWPICIKVFTFMVGIYFLNLDICISQGC